MANKAIIIFLFISLFVSILGEEEEEEEEEYTPHCVEVDCNKGCYYDGFWEPRNEYYQIGCYDTRCKYACCHNIDYDLVCYTPCKSSPRFQK
ncbi:UNVERIFIED_CONTAM: hypothetical protein RMT77_019016 [Armadillidium vulgare]